MMRRPESTDGVLVPQLFAAGVMSALAGLLIEHYATTPVAERAGWWLSATGAMVLVTALLVAWRVLHGTIAAAGGWTVFAAAVLFALPHNVAARGVWPLVITAGVLLTLTLVLATILRGLGAVVAAGLWALWASWLLHAMPGRVGAHAWWPAALAACSGPGRGRRARSSAGGRGRGVTMVWRRAGSC